MFDYICKEAESFLEVEQKIINEAPQGGKEADRKKWFISTIGSDYKSRISSMGWYSDFQKISIHYKEAVTKDHWDKKDKNNIKSIFLSILHPGIGRNLHPGIGRNFTVPDETVSMLKRLTDTRIDVHLYPKYSFSLEFEFILTRPYISKDDVEFYIEENPIRKDKVFKVPMISPSGWKGNMRYAIRQVLGVDDNALRIISLFGNPRKSESNFKMGRLIFYPTFFSQIGVEVFNPHSRKTRAGKQPIFFESVPGGATGKFQLFYFPFDLIGTDCKREIVQDLSLVYDGLSQMFLTFGFSAKKSLDYGIAEKNINGTFKMSGFNLLKDKATPKEKEVEDNKFSTFEELMNLMERMKAEVLKNG